MTREREERDRRNKSEIDWKGKEWIKVGIKRNRENGKAKKKVWKEKK